MQSTKCCGGSGARRRQAAAISALSVYQLISSTAGEQLPQLASLLAKLKQKMNTRENEQHTQSMLHFIEIVHANSMKGNAYICLIRKRTNKRSSSHKDN